jgi:predicted Zn finger-like uncharacterized protein
MPIATSCPNCKALFRLADEMAGKKVKCQKCQSLFVVPKSDAAMTMPGVLASAGNKPAQEQAQPALTATAPPQPMSLPPMPVNPPDAPTKAEADDRIEEGAGKPPPVSKRSRDGQRSASRSHREKAQSSSGTLPVLLALLGLGAFTCIACSGAAVVWHFAAAKRPGPGKKDFAAKDKKDGAAKIDGQNKMKRDGPFDGLNDKRENPPPPGPAIAVNFGPDGSFRQNNQLTQLDPVTPENLRHKLYAIRMEANRTYEIDMISNDFDAYLNVVDETGRIVAADDDSGGNLNARIIFTPARGGLFHIEATHCPQELNPDVPTTGNYTLIIRRR